MKAMYIIHIIYEYVGGGSRKYAYIYKTLTEALEKLKKELDAQDEDIEDWDSTDREGLIVDMLGMAKEYSFSIDIEVGYMKEEP